MLSLAVLLVVSLLWRIAYLGRLEGGPLSGSLAADARVYWEWAGHLLASGPLGSEPFFLGPLYPYVLAAARLALGDSIQGVLHLQAAWGSVAVVLLADATRRTTNPVVGMVVGGMLCFYEMSPFFEGLVLMESLLFFIESLLLWTVIHGGPAWVRTREHFVVGGLIGLLAAGRGTQGLLMIPALAALVPWSGPGRRAASAVLSVAGGALCVIAPVAARNAIVAGEWIPLTYSAGYNLHVGNNPRATGGWVPIAGAAGLADPAGRDGGGVLDGREYLRTREGRAFGAVESSRYWSGRAWDFVRRNPGRALRLTVRKLGMMWSRHEYPQIENVDVYRRVAGPLGLPWVGTFACLGALGLAGAWFAWSRGPSGRFVLGYAAIVTLSVAPFFVTDRFRYHLVPAVALLSAFALERAWSAGLARDRRALARFVIAVLLGAVIVHLPLPHLSAERREWGIAADIGSRWLERGRPDLALPLLREAVEGESKEARRGVATPATRGERARLHHLHGVALLRLGRWDEALAWLERAAREAPERAEFARVLAEARRRSSREGRPDSAEAGVGADALHPSR